jgi:hypothetical protein
MEMYEFTRVAADLKIISRPRNTIVKEWPTQLRLHLKQKGATEEFRALLGQIFLVFHRYGWSPF